MSFLGVGDVIYPRSAVVATNIGGRMTTKDNATADFFDLEGVTFPLLPGSRQEVVSVAGVMLGEKRTLLGKDATEAEFKALPLADFRVIHLAAHGLGNSQFPDRAALVLGGSPTVDQDGLLQVREIRIFDYVQISLRCPPVIPAMENCSARKESRAWNAHSCSRVGNRTTSI